ncbi:hypothetical protein QYF36_023562 [Acer negundo]|nr:hypothetical protein QYF36_023562 [Acer negundo]
MPEGENNASVSCRYSNDGTEWTFRCYKRPNGHPKPAFTTGWLEFVRAKDLRIGDTVTFSMQEDEAGGGGAAQYTIRAERTIRRSGDEQNHNTSQQDDNEGHPFGILPEVNVSVLVGDTVMGQTNDANVKQTSVIPPRTVPAMAVPTVQGSLTQVAGAT